MKTFENFLRESVITEASLSRIWQLIQGEHHNFAVVATTTTDKKTSKENLKLFKDYLDAHKIGYIPLDGGFSEDGKTFIDDTFLIPGMTKDDAIQWGYKLKQMSVLYKEGDKITEYVAYNPLWEKKYEDGSSVEMGDISPNQNSDKTAYVKTDLRIYKAKSGADNFAMNKKAVETYFSALRRGSHKGIRFAYNPKASPATPSKQANPTRPLAGLKPTMESKKRKGKPMVKSFKTFVEALTTIQESSLSRIWQHVEGNTPFGIVSACRAEFKVGRVDSLHDNVARHKNLKYEVSKMGIGYIEMVGKYLEKNEHGVETPVNESSLFMVGIKYDEIMDLAKKYDQDSFIYSDGTKFEMISSNARTGTPVGGVMMSFKKSAGRNNITMMKELLKDFSSRLMKGSHRDKEFLFVSMEERELNRFAGYMSGKETYSKCNLM